MALRIVPSENYQSTYSHLDSNAAGAPSAPGTYDLLRAGVGPTLTSLNNSSTSISNSTDSNHPLENRLKKWEETQEALKMESLRRTFGIAEPIRRGMELKMVREGSWKPACLGGGLERSVHEDILMGTDTGCQWEDIFKGYEIRSIPEFHDEVERKVRMA
ncbi:Proteasome maturation factor UMP1 [Golovinomyces cichoracearum]|uniref:Proteasome maturation factor UMP1 n=1 Tax=Golovinomyces cichoracearum TaxID=62708 RepID=A0A420J2W0_9PEZI|nr:Proteasome maturation factor UMP1 [Golovinomyces cichoracearum]